MIVNFGNRIESFYSRQPGTAVGEVTLGPSGLLDMFETQLGLPSGNPAGTRSLIAYRRCLEESNSSERFYARSFEVDPIGVTRTLLGWRDTWYEHGWNGGFSQDAPARLADMAEVERLASRELLCAGQRLQRVLDALEDRRTEVERIVLLNEPKDLPLMWRRVLDRFQVEVDAGVALSPCAGDGNDLNRVQTTLLRLLERHTREKPEKVPLAGDGSLVLVRGVSRDISAQAVAEYVAKLGGAVDALVIAERDGVVLDNALARIGSPRCGFRHYSRFRAVTQVLKLSVGLLWEPVNPRLLLQFLLHPARGRSIASCALHLPAPWRTSPASADKSGRPLFARSSE